MWEQSFFKENREVFRLYFGENSLVYQNSEDLFSQLDKQFDRAEEAKKKLSKDIKQYT
jgi:transcription-repair coupling factor (superfamily II helicase)